jgi:DNA-directed RNA polymerase specialized sigma24 family protein
VLDIDSQLIGGTQFPFIGNDGLCQAALVCVDDMLVDMAKRINRVAFHLDLAEVDDLVQDCRLKLWQHSLPRYDLHSRPFTKVSTFVHACARSFYYREFARTARRISRFAAHDALDIHDEAADLFVSPHGVQDAQIEKLAERVLSNPWAYLTDRQTEVVLTVADNPEMMKKDLAVMLGYDCPGSLSTIMKRICERLITLEV